MFSFSPHLSHFNAAADAIYLLPDELSDQQAVLCANMETAVSLCWDGAPLLGERVMVLGLGVVGFLTAWLHSEFPLATLMTVDAAPYRRSLARRLGLLAYAPEELRSTLADPGVDLAYELSGQARALTMACRHSRFSGRIIVGSWYGDEAASFVLGTDFHRKRLSLVSSQVSSLNPATGARLDKARRMQLALRLCAKIPAAALISHSFPIAAAASAYELLLARNEASMQIVLTYT